MDLARLNFENTMTAARASGRLINADIGRSVMVPPNIGFSFQSLWALYLPKCTLKARVEMSR